MPLLLCEAADTISTPIIKKRNSNYIRMECVLQTTGDINRNKRRYTKAVLEEGIKQVIPRIKEGSFLGELDHPISRDSIRQSTVLFKEASHRILETWWENNKLKGLVETLNTPNGNILKSLSEQKVPIGFSFRGMGDLKEITEGTTRFFDVVGPLHIITWDCVSNPSHKDAKVLRIKENFTEKLENNILKENIIYNIKDMEKGKEYICENGICYIPKKLYITKFKSIFI